MTVINFPPERKPDAYLPIRDAMATLLDGLATAAESLRSHIISRGLGGAEAAAVGEYSPITGCVNYARSAAFALWDFTGSEDPYEMFDQLENGASSIVNLVMLLRSMEPHA